MMRETRRVAKLLGYMHDGPGGSQPVECVVPLPSCSGVKSLGSADEDGESAASWVVRMKSLAEEKKKAEKKVSLFPPLPCVVLTENCLNHYL